MSFLLDTNVVSEWVKPRPNASVVSWLAQVDEDEVFISVCTLAELRFGIASMPRGGRREHLDSWLRNDLTVRFDGRIVPIDMAIADAWGSIHARGKSVGRTIDVMDGLIAATAEVYDLTIATRDIRDFQATGVSLHDPWTAKL